MTEGHVPTDSEILLQGMLLEFNAKQLRAAQQVQVPWESVLWDAEDIAAHLKVSARTVGEKYAPLPGFPRAARLGGGLRRWYAHEILTWVESTRPAKPRASRAN